MSAELWYVSAPIAGTSIIALGLVVPIVRRRGRNLGAAVEPVKAAPESGTVLRVVSKRRPITARAGTEPSAVLPIRADVESPASEPALQRSAATGSVRAIFRRVFHAARTETDGALALAAPVGAMADTELEERPAAIAPEVVPTRGFSRVVSRLAGAGRVVAARRAAPAEAASAVTLVAEPMSAESEEEDLSRPSLMPEAFVSVQASNEERVAVDVDPSGASVAPAPVVANDPAASLHEVDAAVLENGIVDVAAAGIEPVGESEDKQRARLASRVEVLDAALASVEAERDRALQAEADRAAELAAVQRQGEIERAALVEEARVRAEARTRWWFYRLDADLEFASIEQRMNMASSLGCVRAAWAPKLLNEAFGQEQEPRVRARIIGALAEGGHFEPSTAFVRGFEEGGIERAAVCEVLLPQRDAAPWADALLAPVLASL